MADRSNYADKPASDGAVPAHRLNFGSDARAYTPTSGEPDGEGMYGNLAANSLNGSWEWKPERDARVGANFRPLRSRAKGPAESRPRGAEPDAHFYGGLTTESVWSFQQRAKTAHRDAGDYRRHAEAAYS